MNQALLFQPTIAFAVYGNPAPAGSKSSFVPLNKHTGQPYRGATGRIIVNTVDSNPRAKDWKKLVAAEAQRHRPERIMEGPVMLKLTFLRQRPKGHYRTNGELKPVGLELPFPLAKPDVLKLARGVEDALTGIIWRDDAQIVEELLLKEWGDKPGVLIEIRSKLSE